LACGVFVANLLNRVIAARALKYWIWIFQIYNVVTEAATALHFACPTGLVFETSK
jgi:hypothetical protein